MQTLNLVNIEKSLSANPKDLSPLEDLDNALVSKELQLSKEQRQRLLEIISNPIIRDKLAQNFTISQGNDSTKYNRLTLCLKYKYFRSLMNYPRNQDGISIENPNEYKVLTKYLKQGKISSKEITSENFDDLLYVSTLFQFNNLQEKLQRILLANLDNSEDTANLIEQFISLPSPSSKALSKLSIEQLVSILEKIPEIVSSLDLSVYRSSEIQFLFDALSKKYPSSLVDMDESDTQMDRLIKILAEICYKLEALDLSRTDISVKGLKYLSKNSSISQNLRKLSLADCKMENSPTSSLDSLGTLFPGLRVLDLSNTKLENQSLESETIQSIVSSLPNLKKLKLRRCTDLQDDTILLISKQLRSLKSLDLTDCSDITEDSIGSLATLSSALKTLKLRGTFISKSGIQNLLDKNVLNLVKFSSNFHSDFLHTIPQRLPSLQKLSFGRPFLCETEEDLSLSGGSLKNSGENLRHPVKSTDTPSSLRYLKKLKLPANIVSKPLKKWISSCHHLHELQITSPERLPKAPSFLCNLKELRKLTLPINSGSSQEQKFNKQKTETPAQPQFNSEYYQFLENFPHLRVLKLQDSNITPEHVDFLTTQFPRLKTLEITGNPNHTGMTLPESVWKQLKQMGKLKHITIGHCLFDPMILQDLFNNMCHLQTFHTSFSPGASISALNFRREGHQIAGRVRVARTLDGKANFNKLQAAYKEVPIPLTWE